MARIWHLSLLSAVLTLTAPSSLAAARPDNVDTEASERQRVATMWSILETVVDDLDSGDTAASKRNKMRFLLHVAWHEGAFLTERRQIGGGPGRSFFQFEPARAKDAVLYAARRGWLDELASASNDTPQELRDAAAELTGGKWPQNNKIEAALLNSDLFGAYLTRIAFKNIREEIPRTNAAHAEYWAEHWKRVFDNPDQRRELVRRFEQESDTVDGLLP